LVKIMAIVSPFRGWRYQPGKIERYEEVLAPPYDVIDPEHQRRLHQLHPYNVVRLILGETLPHDNEEDNRYSRAAAWLTNWIQHGILIQDPTPRIYLHHQTFEGFDGRRLVRRGFIALLRLEPLGGGTVFPHEETFPKHKEDRLRLLRACRAHFNPIFALYSDPDRELAPFLNAPAAPPEIRVEDQHGVTHELWGISEPESLAAVRRAMASRAVFIADGHHRYETCLAYMEERRRQDERKDPEAPFNWTLMYFTPMEEEGLLILPTHKLVQGLQGFDPERFLQAVRRRFTLLDWPLSLNPDPTAWMEQMKALCREGETGIAIGLVLHGEPRFRVLKPRDRHRIPAPLSRMPSCLQGLDVTWLHEVLLRDHLGIDVADPGDEHLSYLHDPVEAIRRALEGEVQMAFLMNPVRVKDLQAVALAGCKMPQKATYFYPKLLSGLVINIMDRKGIGG